MDCSMPSFPVLHYLPEFAQTNVHWVGGVDIHLNCFKFSLSQEIFSDICFCVWVTADFLEVELLLQIIRTFYNVVMFSHSVVSDSFRSHGAWQVPPFMEFLRQEYWRGLPFPPPGDLPNRGVKLASLVSPALVADSLPTALPGKLPYMQTVCVQLFLSCLTLCDWPYAL